MCYRKKMKKSVIGSKVGVLILKQDGREDFTEMVALKT